MRCYSIDICKQWTKVSEAKEQRMSDYPRKYLRAGWRARWSTPRCGCRGPAVGGNRTTMISGKQREKFPETWVITLNIGSRKYRGAR